MLPFIRLQQRGAFVSINWDWIVYRRRTPDESPSGYGDGGTLFLLRAAGGWVVVDVVSFTS